jgi:hypothetical protein
MFNTLGWTSVPLAATTRKVASQMMGVIFFGENVCEYCTYKSRIRMLIFSSK